MKSCDYCSRENEDVSVHCRECGTEFPQPVSGYPHPPELKPPRVLNAKFATIIFIIALAAMIPATFVAVLVGFIFIGDVPDFLQSIFPWTVLFSQVCTGGALVWSTIAFGFPTNDTSPTGVAWVRGSWRAIAGGALTGVLIFFTTALILTWMGPSHSSHGTSPFERMSMTPGFPETVWIINSVLFAPVIEELLFRGVLYGGYRRSFGHGWSVIVTTSIFVLLHFPAPAHRPIDGIELAAMALASLWWRLRSSSIGPCVAVHFAYNSLVTLEHLSWLHRR
jgi:membrane protease YdiL (CAAX protease family)